MISDSDIALLKDIVQSRFSFGENPDDIMWTTTDGDPIDDCDAFWGDPDISDVKYGCSKVVLFYHYLEDYVLKIPFLGECTEDGVYNNFTNATCGSENENNWDYCRAEEIIYELTCGEGLGDLFCGTRYLCDIQGFPVYVSEMSENALDEDAMPHHSSAAGLAYIESKRQEPGKQFYYAPADMDDDTIGMFYDSWGKELTDKLLDFLVDNDIRDCHNGNVAFRDGKIRLIDYSGFYK